MHFQPLPKKRGTHKSYQVLPSKNQFICSVKNVLQN